MEVYKMVCKADKKSCKSCVQSFIYEANTLYKIPSIELKKSYMYRTYSVLSGIYQKGSIYKSKGIIVGNQLTAIRLDNPYYVATFVIPKGSQYAVNWRGEIISNQIIYTGKHLKL